MNVDLLVNHKITPRSLAEALSNATPQEFAMFWFEFSNVCDDTRLDAFAKAMSPELGGQGKAPLKRLNELVQFYEISRARQADVFRTGHDESK